MSGGEHLHLVREERPPIKPGYRILQFYCPVCLKAIYVIHLDLPPENPK